MSIEDPDVDRYEQQLPASYDEDDEVDVFDSGKVPPDADPLDFVDQRRSVPSDDDREG
jgi:hypothetical protein